MSSTWLVLLAVSLGGSIRTGGENLVPNGGFEEGLAGWRFFNNSGRGEVEVDGVTRRKGRQALHVSRKGGRPADYDVLRADIQGLPTGGRVTVSAEVKARTSGRAFLKFFLWDGEENPLQKDVDLLHITGSFNWRHVERAFDVPRETAYGSVMLVLVLDGEVWLDEVRVEPKPGTRPAKQPASPSTTQPGSDQPQPGSDRPNRLHNGGFEDGATTGWLLVQNSGNTKVEIDRAIRAEGKFALHVTKSGPAPFDVLRAEVSAVNPGDRVRVSARLKGSRVEKAFLKFFAWDSEEASLIADVDVEEIRDTFNWKQIAKTYDLPPRTSHASVMLVMVLAGEVWLDDVRVERIDAD